MYIYRIIEQRPYGLAVTGLICIVAVDVLRAAFYFEFVRIPLNLLSASGFIVGLLALGELVYQIKYQKRKVDALRLSALAILTVGALLLLSVRHGAEVLKFSSVN